MSENAQHFYFKDLESNLLNNLCFIAILAGSMNFYILKNVQNSIKKYLMNNFNIHTQIWSGVSETMTPIVVSKSQFSPVYEIDYF